MKLGKVFLISLQELFSLTRKSNFNILDIQVSWRHQVPKIKKRITFYWITWKVNTVCWWNLASLCHIIQGKKIWKNSTKTVTLKRALGPFLFAENLSTTSVGKWNFWNKLLKLNMYQQNYQNLSQLAYWPPQILFYRGFFEN